MIASEISVCLNQGNGLQAARLSNRDGGSRETLGEEEVPRLGNSQDSLTARFQRVPSGCVFKNSVWWTFLFTQQAFGSAV